VLWTIRQRLTRLLTCSMRTRRRATRRLAAVWAAGEGSASWLAGRHDDLHLVERERLEAQILAQPTAHGSGRGGGICHPLLVSTPLRGLTQEENRAHGVDQPHMFDRGARFLAATTARLLSRILGTPDASFAPILCNRGEAWG
jgi:hypothetical protein